MSVLGGTSRFVGRLAKNPTESVADVITPPQTLANEDVTPKTNIHSACTGCLVWLVPGGARKVDMRLPGKGNSNSHGTRLGY